MIFKRIGLALAFSPTAEGMLSEAAVLRSLFGAELILIHVGSRTDREEAQLKALLEKTRLSADSVRIIWRTGDPARQILAACRTEAIDLLVAGALKREKLLKYYVGTIARKIMRKASCSILMIISPSLTPRAARNIVVSAEDGAYASQALQVSCRIAEASDDSRLHIVRELKLYGLAMSAAHQHSADEYNKLQELLIQDEVEQVTKMLQPIPHAPARIRIKVLSGKSGLELSKFASRERADLLVAGAPARRFSLLDRLFPHDLEYVFADLPCNLLMVNQRKEADGAKA